MPLQAAPSDPGDGLCDRTLPAEGTDFCAILTKLRFPVNIPHVFQPGWGSENSLGQVGSAATPESSGQLPRRDFRGSCPPEEGEDNPGTLERGSNALKIPLAAPGQVDGGVRWDKFGEIHGSRTQLGTDRQERAVMDARGARAADGGQRGGQKVPMSPESRRMDDNHEL